MTSDPFNWLVDIIAPTIGTFAAGLIVLISMIEFARSFKRWLKP